MGTMLLVSATGPERRVALVENGVTTEVLVESARGRRLTGNIYYGRVVRVLPGMQSAFLDLGLERTAFLYAGDLNDDVANDESEVPINQRLTEGQSLLVQIAKEPMGTKGARVTNHISLPGRFLVLLPENDHVGISRRIEDAAERERLKETATAFCPEGFGLIVRTVAEQFDTEGFKDDLAFLERLWKELSAKVDNSKVPALIHEDLDLILKATRDLLRPDFDALYVDDDAEFERISAFVETFMPRCSPLIKRYTEKVPLFTRYGVDPEISRATEGKVWLKSGGSIVIEHTEALTAIDVNTGRYVGKSNLEDTILKINLEAVKEVAYQLRLRNIGGIIVIDFIDMESEVGRTMVQEAMESALSHDRVRTNVLPMSSLGLIEMTRKRVGESLTQTLTENCHYCGSRGWTLSRSEIARQVLNKVLDTLSSQGKISSVAIDAHPKIVEALYEGYREDLAAIELEYGAKLAICEKEFQCFDQFTVKGS